MTRPLDASLKIYEADSATSLLIFLQYEADYGAILPLFLQYEAASAANLPVSLLYEVDCAAIRLHIMSTIPIPGLDIRSLNIPSLTRCWWSRMHI